MNTRDSWLLIGLLVVAAWWTRRRLSQQVEPRAFGAAGLVEPVTLFEHVVAFAAPPEEVFRVLGDPRSKLVWVPAIKRVELLSNPPPGLDTRYLASSGVGPVEFVFHEQIVGWEPPRRLVYGGRSPWGRFQATWMIEARPGGAWARCHWDYWFPGGRFGRLLGSALGAVVRGPITRGIVARLKEVVEAGTWQPAGRA